MPKSAPLNRRPDALELFTDRVSEQEVVRQALAPARHIPQEAELLVTCFYGVGGVGKTTLCRRARAIAREELPKLVTVVHTSFDDPRWTSASGFASVSAEVCRVLQSAGIDVSLSAALLAVWSEAGGPGGGIEERWQLALDAIDKGVEMAGIPGLSLLVKGALHVRDQVRRRDIRSRLENFALWPADNEGRLVQTDVEKLLPLALYHDVRTWLLGSPSRQLRMLIDGFERIQGTEIRHDAQNGLQEFCGYFASADQIDERARFRVLVFGRDRLTWDELYRDEDWKNYWNQHLLGGLGEKDARSFLDKAADWRAKNGEEETARVLRDSYDRILDASDERVGAERLFHPYSLDLAVELVDRTKGAGLDLGLTPVELQERFLRYLEPRERRALMILAMAETFDEKLFEWLVERRLVDYARHTFDTALVAGHSYFHEIAGLPGTWKFHRQMEAALQRAWLASDAQKKEGRKLIEELLAYWADQIGTSQEKDWGEAQVMAWSRGMEVIVTQGPELGLLNAEEWRSKLKTSPWSIDHHLCLHAQVGFQERIMRGARVLYGDDHPDTLASMANLASACFNAGRLQQALVLREEVLRLRREKLGEEHPDTLRAMAKLAVSYESMGRLEETVALEEEVLRLRRERLGEDHPDTLKAMANLAMSHRSMGRLEEAVQLEEEVLRLRREKFGEEHPDTFTAMAKLAVSYESKGRLEKTLALEEEVLRLRREKLGEEHPDTLRAMANLAATYEKVGRLEEAVQLEEEVLRLRRAKLGEDHPDTLRAMANLAMSHRDMGKLEEAVALEEEVLRLRREKLGEDHPEMFDAMVNLAASYRSMGKLEEAVQLEEEVLRLRREKFGEEHPGTFEAMTNLAVTYGSMGKLEEAVALEEEVLRLRREKFGEDHPDTLRAMANLAVTYGKMGELEEAVALEEEVLRLRREKFGEDHPEMFDAMVNLADSYRSMGKLEEAVALEEEVLRLRREKFGEDHPDTLRAMANLAASHYKAGRFAVAVALEEEVLRLRCEKLGEDHPETFDAMADLAATYEKMGWLEETAALQEQVLRLRRAKFREEHPATLAVMVQLAATYESTGRLEKTLALEEEVLRLRREKFGEDHPDTIKAAESLAFTLAELGQPQPAANLLRLFACKSAEARHAVCYNLSCYECLLGNMAEAKELIAEHLSRHPEDRAQALDDPDLVSIRDFVATL